MRNIIKVWFFVFASWLVYRLIFRFPEWVDELLVKPVIFILLPLGITRFKTIPGFEKKKNVFEEIVIGVGVGFIFAFVALMANKLKHGSFLFAPTLPLYGIGILFYLSLSLATSISEEILSRGFFFGILKKYWGVFLAATVSSLLSLTLHLPILATRLNLAGVTLTTFLTSVFLLSMVNSYIYQNRKSLILPILIHTFWNMTVALYL